MGESPRYLVAAFYAFTALNHAQREDLLALLPSAAGERKVLGSILIAHEGVNLSLIHI